MVYRTSKGEIGALDYREKAPLISSKDMYLDSLRNVIPKMSTQGATAVGVPGTIAGVFKIHQKFDSLPIQDIFAPVIQLAEKGEVVTENQAKRLNKIQEVLKKVNDENTFFVGNYKKGDTLSILF